MSNVTFNYCTQAVFEAKMNATPGTLLDGGLYFITDSGRLYRATSNSTAIVYSQPFQIVNSFPASGNQGCLYIHATTHEVKVYDGSSWTTVIPATSTATVYKYKGSCTYANLPSSGQETGDVWNVTDANGAVPAGTNYAWDGTGWDALGGSVDLSSYLTANAASATYLTQQAAASTYLTQSSASSTYATKDVATQSANGLMSAQDKTKLDGLGSLTWTEATSSQT